jgi:uncharacterized protein YecE (DUF72 family)
MAVCSVHIGTSGWHYQHWVGTFYPPKTPASQMFQLYTEHFDTVELNNSFYRLPSVDTFCAWHTAAPPKFLYAVKASRFITHNLKLKNPQNALDNILSRAEALGEKLGPVLFQLPPRWRKNVERLDEFLSVLPPYHRYVFEFREPSWHCDEVYAVLRKHNAAYCIHEIAGFHTELTLTADFTYVRLHGPGAGKYEGSYTPAQLQRWAKQIRDWNRTLNAIYIYFDNDQAGFAPRNAISLKQLVAGTHTGRRKAA